MLVRRDPAHAVAARIEQRAVRAEPEPARLHGGDAATDSALRRQPDTVEPLTREVVHAARRHHGQHPADSRGRDDDVAGQRIYPAGSQRGGHHREVLGRDKDRALPEIGGQRDVDVDVEGTDRPQQEGDRTVAVAGHRFRFVDSLIDVEWPAGEGGQPSQHLLEPLVVRAADEGRGDDGARVHHGIERSSQRVDADRVERIPGRLDAHLRQHVVDATLGESKRVYERLRHRLDRERLEPTCGIDVPVEGGESQSERRGVSARQLGDVSRELAAAVLNGRLPRVVQQQFNRPAARRDRRGGRRLRHGGRHEICRHRAMVAAPYFHDVSARRRLSRPPTGPGPLHEGISVIGAENPSRWENGFSGRRSRCHRRCSLAARRRCRHRRCR